MNNQRALFYGVLLGFAGGILPNVAEVTSLPADHAARPLVIVGYSLAVLLLLLFLFEVNK